MDDPNWSRNLEGWSTAGATGQSFRRSTFSPSPLWAGLEEWNIEEALQVLDCIREMAGADIWGMLALERHGRDPVLGGTRL